MRNLALTLALTVPAVAQSPAALVLDGDVVPGVGVVTSFSNLAVNDAGEWLVEVDTDNADTDADGALLASGVLLLREGQLLAAPAGAQLGAFDALSLTLAGDLGQNLFLDGVPAGTDSGVYWNDQLVLREGDTPNLPGVTPGSPMRGFFDVKLNDADRLLVLATLDDPALPTSVDQVLCILDAPNGTLTGATVVAKEGDVLAGQTEQVATFSTSPHSTAFNNAGDVVFQADLTGDTATDAVLYSNGTVLAQQGGASPIAGRNWSNLTLPNVDVNEQGVVVFRGSLDGDTSSNWLIVNDGTKFRQTGDSLPAIAPFTLTSFGTGPLFVDETGSVVWYGDWDDPDIDRDTGYFVNDRLVVQEGVTTSAGSVIDVLFPVSEGFTVSPNGRWLLFKARLEDGRDGAFLVDLTLGQRYCSPAVDNSTGAPAELAVLGSPVAGGNPLRLVATKLPPNQFAYFLLSQSQGNTAGPGGSQGVLCLSGNIGRFTAQVQSTGPAGFAAIDVDTTAAPINPTGPLLAGQSWSFQGWYRDANPGATSNFTDGVEVTFL